MDAQVVADAAGMTLADYGMSEDGKRRFTTAELYRIAKTLGVDLKDVLVVL
jgi:hypothetical protein